MASVYEAWRKKYSEAEYNIKVLEYKEILRKKAKESKFGGVVYVSRTCKYCNVVYDGVSNQLMCNTCKDQGVMRRCKHCNIEFFTKKVQSNCCETCNRHRPWLNKSWSSEQRDKFQKSKKLWYESPEGVLFKEKISKINSEKMKSFNLTPEGISNIKRKAKNLSKIMKEKIALGEFTPRITNTRTHWNAKIILYNGDEKRFRSSWEAAFWASNMHLEYETLRIPWTSKLGTHHTYIPDFFDKVKNIIYEIKPRSQYVNQDEKMQQAIQYCLANNIKFIWINEMNILNYINLDDSIYNINENYQQLNKVINAVNKNKNKIN